MGCSKVEVVRVVVWQFQIMFVVVYVIFSEDLVVFVVVKIFVSDVVLVNFYLFRLGDIYVVFELYWFVGDFDGLYVVFYYGLLWIYDIYVLIIFFWFDIILKWILCWVEIIDVVLMVVVYLKIKVFSGLCGDVLDEVLYV